MSANLYQDHLTTRKNQEAQAVQLLVELNTLANKGVNVLFFGNRIALNLVDIIAHHDKNALNIADTLAFATALNDQNLSHTTVDLGQALKAGKQADSFTSGDEVPATDVVLYGFGRIGRLLAREMMSKIGKGQQLRLRAIVTRDKNVNITVKNLNGHVPDDQIDNRDEAIEFDIEANYPLRQQYMEWNGLSNSEEPEGGEEYKISLLEYISYINNQFLKNTR
jgi:hypothetical protein